MTITIRTVLLLTALTIPAGAVAKQAPDFEPGRNPPGQGGRPVPKGGGPLPGLDNGEMTPNEIQKLFDAYMVMEVQRALDLNDQQYGQFLPRLRTLQEARRRSQMERNQTIAQLQRLSNPRLQRMDEAQIKQSLSVLQELEARSAAEMRKAYSGIDEMLSIVQQARFRVFEEAIERRKIELLMRARQQNRPRQQQQ